MATEILRPNSAGDVTQLNPIGAPTNWECVDEETPDEDTTRLYSDNFNPVGYLEDLFNLPASSGSGTINKITVYFRCTGETTFFIKPVIKSDSTVTYGTELNPTASWVTYNQEWAVNPADSQAWEWADIDALQIGIALQSRTKNGLSTLCTQLYVVVDYTSGPTPNAYNKIFYTSEPPTPNAWNQVKREAGTGWRKLEYS